jgi:hypothetical protein
MGMPSRLCRLAVLIIVVSVVQLQLPGTSVPTIDAASPSAGATTGPQSDPVGAENWFYAQRAAPNATIPAATLRQARLQYESQIKRGVVRPGVQGTRR